MRSLAELTGFDMFLVDISLKAGLILAVAWAISLVLWLCRGSAASRHAAWSLAIGSVLGLPALSVFLPSWSISLPRQESVPLAFDIPATASNRSPLLVVQTPVEGLSSVPTNEPELGSRTEVATTITVRSAASAPVASKLPTLSEFPFFLAVWLFGACLALMPAGLGLLSLWRLGRTARLVNSGPLATALRQLMNQLGMNCSVRLLESRTRTMPMTWGIWRPTILLPDEARHWTSDRLRIVLLHELAHIQRRDCLTQMLAQFARARSIGSTPWLGLPNVSFAPSRSKPATIG